MQSDMTREWIPVALSADLPPATVLPAHLPSGILALWRSASGKVTASADRCPHRGMRLSYGFVRGEALSCIYHGWSYGQTGNCLRIPAHPGLTPPEAIKVETFAAEETDGVIWVALERPDAPPPSLEGFAPLRSMTLSAGPAFSEPQVRMTLAGLDALLLIVPLATGETAVHVLIQSGASNPERIAASRALESWRRTTEQSALPELAS